MKRNCWPQTKVDDMIRRGVLAPSDGDRIHNVELGPAGIPFVRGGDIGNGGIKTEFADHIRPEFTDRVQSKLTRPYDVAFITKGTVGRVGMVRPSQPPAVFAPQVCYWRSLDPNQLEPQFLFYLLTSSEFQANLDAVKTHGSMTADYVSMTDQRDSRLTLAPLPEQKAIAVVLGALDDKIELNRRMNATLEAMARALFQSWFIDFDPVRAKLDGRQPPNLDPATAALFSDSFDETKVGHIPAGWHLGRLADLCNLKRGHDLPSSTRTAGTIPVISSSWISGTHSKTDVRGPGVVTGRYGTISKVFYIETDYWPLNTTLFIDDFKGNPPRFIFHALGEVNFQNYTDKAAVPGVNRNHLHEEPTLLSPIELRQAFARAVSPLWSQHAANERQSRTLATRRDTLLPKLLSGELAVPSK